MVNAGDIKRFPSRCTSLDGDVIWFDDTIDLHVIEVQEPIATVWCIGKDCETHTFQIPTMLLVDVPGDGDSDSEGWSPFDVI